MPILSFSEWLKAQESSARTRRAQGIYPLQPDDFYVNSFVGRYRACQKAKDRRFGVPRNMRLDPWTKGVPKLKLVSGKTKLPPA